MSPVVRQRLLAIALVAGLGGLPAAAQAPKFAVINTQQIVFESATGKTALETLKVLQQEKANQLKGLQDEAEQLRNRLNEGLALSDGKVEELKSQLETKLKDLRRKQEDAAQEVEKRRDELLREIEAKVMPVINEVGKEQGYTMIFRKFESGLIYVDDAVDITGQVIQRLDASKGVERVGAN
jgi:outer membrane protein